MCDAEVELSRVKYIKLVSTGDDTSCNCVTLKPLINTGVSEWNQSQINRQRSQEYEHYFTVSKGLRHQNV